MTKKAKRDYQREWARKKRIALKNGNGKHENPEDFVGIINAFKILHAATNNGQTKSDLKKTFATIVSETF